MMAMKKKLTLILALLLMLSVLAGCGASKNADSAEMEMYSLTTAPAEAPQAMDMVYGGGYNYKAKAESANGAAIAEEQKAAPDAGTGLPANVKLIYRANIELESTAFDSAVEALQKLTADCGGYYENSGLNNYGSYRYANYTLRIPAEQFRYFCDTVSSIGEEGELFQVNSINHSAEDVSEAYYDVESRLATQKTKLERLQSLLKKADKMEDIISLESAISETELAIEQLTGSLRRYDSLVGYSTITISLSEVFQLSETEEPAIGFGSKLLAAFRTGCRRFVWNLEDFLLSFARGWIGWLIFLAIAAVVIVLIVRGIRKRRGAPRRRLRIKKATPAEPEQPKEDAE